MHSRSKRNNDRRGRYAEISAAALLTLKGYRILARRWKCHAGEIDLIARRGKTLAFIEVKARPTPEMGMEAITAHQRQRIERAAAAYLQTRAPDDFSCRFDVICCSPPFRIRHLMDAWRPL